MEINDLRVQKYNKISLLANISSPELLSTIRIVDHRVEFQYVDSYKGIYQDISVLDKNNHSLQLYITKLPIRDEANQIVYLKTGPKVLILKGDPQNIIIEDNIYTRLNQKLIEHQSNFTPYLDQMEALRVIQQVSQSLNDYITHKIVYDCITDKNIVMGSTGKWQLSTVGLVLGLDINNPSYTIKTIKNSQFKMTFALGCLLFKLIFGFSPIHSSGKLDHFSIGNYFNNLVTQSSQKHLKIYHYSERCLEVSPGTLKIIQDALSGTLHLQKWFSILPAINSITHIPTNNINNLNKQIMMINSVQPNGYSLIMSAIDYKKNHPLEKFNVKAVPSPDDPTLTQALEKLQKNGYFRYLDIDPSINKKSSLIYNNPQQLESGPINIPYFYQQVFDPETDQPCLDLISWLKNHNVEYNSPEDCHLKLYAYPYTVAFQLMKVEKEQSVQIRRKIKKTIQILFQLSALNYPHQNIQPLHRISPKFNSFQQIKPTFRESINTLYQYFLNQSMRKYNSKSEIGSMIERAKKKQQGLSYYRLCLKLMQASLLIRKQGKDLDLSRIHTSQRRQIQEDLSKLLGKYFPKRPQLH